MYITRDYYVNDNMFNTLKKYKYLQNLGGNDNVPYKDELQVWTIYNQKILEFPRGK